MTWLIWWIKQWFCDHDFEYCEIRHNLKEFGELVKSGIIVSRTCTECGWHTSYWKFEP